MTHDQIEEVMKKKHASNSIFEIRFKTRTPIKGMFIKSSDYAELSRKNLWRIVRETYIAEYNKSHDENLARIFNGSEFTKLEMLP